MYIPFLVLVVLRSAGSVHSSLKGPLLCTVLFSLSSLYNNNASLVHTCRWTKSPADCPAIHGVFFFISTSLIIILSRGSGIKDFFFDGLCRGKKKFCKALQQCAV